MVNDPEIAWTLGECLIQSRNRYFFMNYVIFVSIFKLSHIASTKVTKASLWMETLNKCG